MQREKASLPARLKSSSAISASSSRLASRHGVELPKLAVTDP